jgi:hypothetical protein
VDFKYATATARVKSRCKKTTIWQRVPAESSGESLLVAVGENYRWRENALHTNQAPAVNSTNEDGSGTTPCENIQSYNGSCA